MLKEACLVAFVAVDVGRRVLDGRRKKRAKRAQAELAQQRALRAPLAPVPAAAGAKPGIATPGTLRRQALPYMGIQAVLIATILSGTNIYYPDAWLATAAVCSAVLCVEIVIIMVVQRMLQQRAARIISLSASALAAAPTTPAAVMLLNGLWIKDKEASDSMEPAMDLMQLGGLLRRAIGLVKGVDIRVSADSFEFAITSVVPGFKVWERYPMSGESRRHRRRDLRKGGAEGRVTVTADALLRVDVTWGEPHGGAGYDLYVMPDANTLVVKSFIQLAHGSAGYSIVYRRRM